MSVRIASRWVSLNVLLGFVLFVGGEHFYLPKENNVFSNDPQDDWVPISGIDKRSTRPNHGVTKIVHITPPVRFPHRSSDLQLQAMSASNKVEVFAQPPPTVLGSFTEFGHSTVEAREPAHALNFRPSYHFERQHRDEINDRRYQEPEEQTHPSVVVFNAQQRHPQNYLKPTPPQQYYQNYVPYYNGNGNNNNKNFGFKEPPAVVQEAQIVPKRLTPYSVSNDHVFPRPQQQQLPGNSKLQAYAEQRPPKHPYPVNPAEQQLQRYQQPQHQQQQQQQKQQQQHYQQTLQQQQQQQQHNQKQPYRTSAAEGAVQSSAYFHKYYPGQVIDGQNPFPEVSNFARPFEQITTNDHDVYIRPNQQVHNLNVGTEVRFGPEPSTRATALQQEPTIGGVTHPATRPFSKYQTPSPKNEELYRIFPVKEVNALPPAFLPTPIAPHTPKAGNGRPKAPNDAAAAAAAAVGSSEYDESQNEYDSGEQYYDIVRSRTKPMMTTTTTSTTTTTTTTTSAPPRSTRKKKPSTTTAAAPPDEYDEYAAAVHNRQQLQLQEHDEHQPQQHAHGREPTAAEPNGDVPPQPPAVSVNKYKKKKPLPAARPKEPVRPERPNESSTERAAAADPPPTVSSSTAVAAAAAAAAPATTVPSGGGGVAEAATAADARAKAKLKYGNGTRPRFSIKDYRTTTAPSTAAAPTEAAPTDTATGGRKPYKPRTNRYRTSAASRATEEPPAAETTTMTMTTTTTSTTDRNAYRSKYKPGKYYSRSRTTTSTESAAAAAAADETATVATAEPTRPAAVYSAKRRTVAARTTASPAEENSAALRRGSSAAPLIGGGAEETLGAASSEDADYATTAVAAAVTRPKYQAADRPLLPIESFFQSSMGGKRHRHSERR